jgi:hypothetical protein
VKDHRKLLSHVCFANSYGYNKTVRRCYLNRQRIHSFQTVAQLFQAFNVHGSVHRKYIPIYIQQDATLHSLFYLETALHVSGGTTTNHQDGKQLYLQSLVFAAMRQVAVTV